MITMGNMACGLLGIGFVMAGQEWMGFLMMLLGAGLDFFDGFAARKLGMGENLAPEMREIRPKKIGEIRPQKNGEIRPENKLNYF